MGESKKLFSKVKNNVKLACASEGHQLKGAPVSSVAPQIVQLQTDSQVSLRSSSNSSRTTDSIRRQAKSRDIKEPYLGNREMAVDSAPAVDYTTLLLYVLRYLVMMKLVPLKYVTELFQASEFILSENEESIIYEENSIKQLQLAQRTLRNRKPIKIQLDRNLKIFQPTTEQSSIPTIQLLPQDPLFYQATLNEILHEKQKQCGNELKNLI
ncbi:unnamed protein product [Rotaria magnacalcarata]